MIETSEARRLPVDARAIEAELAAIWRDLSERGLARASSLTLIVVLDQPALNDAVDSAINRVAANHPCRVIRLVKTEAEAQAQLSVRCQLTEHGRTASSWEDIRLEGPQADSGRLLSAARALPLPNLPIQAWCPGNPALDGSLFARLVDLADRVIINSTESADPLATLCRYATQAEEQHGTVGFVDLAWRGLEAWRLAVAQFFDDPADRAYLNGIRSVMVSYAQSDDDGHGGFAEALLLIGWLASRLGWTVSAEQALDAVLFDDGARGVRVHFRRLPTAELIQGKLVGVELRASTGGRSASYAIEKVGATGAAVATIAGVRREGQVALPDPQETDLLDQELGAFGRDRIFEEALQVVLALGRRTGKSDGLK